MNYKNGKVGPIELYVGVATADITQRLIHQAIRVLPLRNLYIGVS